MLIIKEILRSGNSGSNISTVLKVLNLKLLSQRFCFLVRTLQQYMCFPILFLLTFCQSFIGALLSSSFRRALYILDI